MAWMTYPDSPRPRPPARAVGARITSGPPRRADRPVRDRAQAATRRRPRRRSTSPDTRAARAEAAMDSAATPVRGSAGALFAGAGATARAVSTFGIAATAGRIDGGVTDPGPELAAVVKAPTGFRPRAVFTPRTSAAPLVMPLWATPPEAVR